MLKLIMEDCQRARTQTCMILATSNLTDQLPKLAVDEDKNFKQLVPLLDLWLFTWLHRKRDIAKKILSVSNGMCLKNLIPDVRR